VLGCPQQNRERQRAARPPRGQARAARRGVQYPDSEPDADAESAPDSDSDWTWERTHNGIGRHDRDLGGQLRRALSSVVLNIAEGNSSEGGNRLSRFSTAAGSNGEARAALRVAVAWGYVGDKDIAQGEALLDRVAAMLHRLGARR
jgi:four helix bundle protein